MYAYMRGELADICLDYVILDVNGIGYQLYIPSRDLNNLQIGTEIKLHTYLAVREDAMVLYGFLSKEDLQMFRLLIGVSGIGPKGGLAILSLYTARELQFFLLAGDSKAISKASGIGAKTAQRVIIDLKDKIDFEETVAGTSEETVSVTMGAKDSQSKNDAILALTALGYSQSESMRAVSAVKITEDMDVETILKLALKAM